MSIQKNMAAVEKVFLPTGKIIGSMNQSFPKYLILTSNLTLFRLSIKTVVFVPGCLMQEEGSNGQ